MTKTFQLTFIRSSPLKNIIHHRLLSPHQSVYHIGNSIKHQIYLELSTVVNPGLPHVQQCNLILMEKVRYLYPSLRRNCIHVLSLYVATHSFRLLSLPMCHPNENVVRPSCPPSSVLPPRKMPPDDKLHCHRRC